MKQEPSDNSKSTVNNGRLTGKKTPPRGYENEDMKRRVDWLAEQTGHRIDDFSLESPVNYKGLVENQIGYIGLPLSIAGPLKITGSYANGDFYVPLCTLEGTLSLSMTRGLYLAHQSGGITSRHINQQLSRSPVFVFETYQKHMIFCHGLMGMAKRLK